jgi:hypothetical protein
LKASGVDKIHARFFFSRAPGGKSLFEPHVTMVRLQTAVLLHLSAFIL